MCTLRSTDTPAFARELAEQEQFDLVPIREGDNRIISYVRRETLERAAAGAMWSDVEQAVIHPNEIVSANSPILDLLDRFGQDPQPLFVLGQNGIDAIVTVYDLNQPAAHQFGFALSLVVEAHLAREIEIACRNSPDEPASVVDARILGKINGFPRGAAIRKRAAKWSHKAVLGDQVRLTQELVFADKIALAKRMRLAPELASRCTLRGGIDGTELIRSLDHEVRALRNAVAHDLDALADEVQICKWMQTTLALARELGPTPEVEPLPGGAEHDG